MAQYIDKDALVAEIEKMLQEEYSCDNSEQTTGYHCALYELQDFLNSLEVKEVDLKKEVDSQMDLLCNLLCYMEELSNGDFEGVYPFPVNVNEDLQRFAKHFYELGLKAKGE